MKHHRAAYTLIETLVCVFVVALLTGVLLTSIRSVRGNVTITHDLLNLGLTSKEFVAYSSDRSGRLPNAGLPQDAASAAWFYLSPNDPQYCLTRYLSHDVFWPLILYDWSGETQRHWHASSGPAWSAGQRTYEWDDVAPRLRAWMPSAFEYAISVMTSEELWEPGRAAASGFGDLLPHYRVVSMEQIRSPSAKGLLLYRRGAGSNTHWMAAFADGRVERREIGAFREAAPYPIGDPQPAGTPVLTTKYGILGEDI